MNRPMPPNPEQPDRPDVELELTELSADERAVWAEVLTEWLDRRPMPADLRARLLAHWREQSAKD